MTTQWSVYEGQDKHGLRSEPRPCELCGQLVVSVCDSLDMGEAVTFHYEPANEDETAKRIAELEAENTALRDVNKRLNNDANLLMESNAQLTEENAALRRDAVTCHYEPATEDEKAMRIAELVAELATLHSRLEFTSCQKADVEAQVLELEEQNAALREVVQTLRKSLAPYWPVARFDLTAQEILALKAALEAAGLVENTDGTD